MTTDEALAALLGDQRSGELRADLIAAAREAMARRERNTVLGGIVLDALNRDEHLSWRQIEELTGIARTTAQRWAEPPKRADTEEQPE